MKDKSSEFDASRSQFVFYMKDDNGQEEKVIFDGAKPNNFELADAVVVKGRYQDGCFRASEILTKCPSKYEAQPGARSVRLAPRFEMTWTDPLQAVAVLDLAGGNR